MNIKDYFGPGYWAVMHIDSLHAKTFDEKIEVSKTIARIITNFPCTKCRRHATEYASENPLIYSINDSDELSLFKWVWKFHNAVNKRLDKKIFDFDEAKRDWEKNNICIASDCD